MAIEKENKIIVIEHDMIQEFIKIISNRVKEINIGIEAHQYGNVSASVDTIENLKNKRDKLCGIIDSLSCNET